MRRRRTWIATAAAIALGAGIAGVIVTSAAAGGAAWTPGAPLILRGTIVTPQTIIQHGYIRIENGRITVVSDRRPALDGAVLIDTEGTIYPGLVDVHNHVPWNVLPRWIPPHLYSNRSEWRADPDQLQEVAVPFNDLLAGGHVCDMNDYGEMRALAGGATSILATQRVACIRGLVRNLDYNSGFYGTTELNREHILNIVDVPPAGDPNGRSQFVAQARSVIASPFFEALFLHLAEGVDAFSLEEFTFIQSSGLLNPKGACVHCLALGPDEFRAMAAADTSLVWSPRSNVELYGRTTDIEAALDAGVRIALAPDWAVTGSSSILDELRFADQWNREHLNGRLTDAQLVAMVTSTPAAIAGIADEVGTIQPGLRADLLVISGDEDDPYRQLIEAGPHDVRLVLVGGVPAYGNAEAMRAFWNTAQLEPIDVGPGAPMALAAPAADFRLADVVSRLEAALQAEGSSLAPLTESH
ncbi:MAG: amidohydrolase family protein [Candidatus Polarisedimenticolia bacterium]